MDQKQFERLLAGEYASQQPQIAEPNRIGRSGYQSEAALRETVQLTPEERLLDQQTNANPAVFAELEREIRNARDPKARAVLEQELARQRDGGQVAPAQNLIRPTWVADESLPDFGKARRRADAQAKADESPISTQLGRGVKTLAHNVGLLKDTLLDDSEGAAQRIVEKRKYDEENPQPTSVQDFTKDWSDLSDDDYLGMAKTFLKNPSGTFGMMVEQTPNSIPGLAANIAALGLTAFNPAMGFATKAAIQGIASLAGNLGPEGGAVIEERLQKAGVDPDNHAQLAQWLKDNRADNLVAGVSKAGVISVADAVTANLGAKLMAGPSMRFANAEREFLTSKGVDLKDAAKIRAARATDDYKATMQPFAKDVADATGKAQLFGRAVGSTLLDAAGEGAGEYLGSLAAHGEASVKDAVLEGVMGVGQGTAMAGAGYALGKLSGPDATEQEIRKLAEYQAKQQAQQPDPQPNSPLSNAAQAATPVDPFAEALAPITARLNDRDLFAKIRGIEQLGPNAMSDILASYRVATNPTLDPMRRQAAVDRLNGFFTAFDSMPNFTFGNAQQDSAQPVSNLPATKSASQSGPVGFADPSVGSINGESRVVSDPVAIGGQRRLPAPPRRLSAPPPALIADNREAQRIVAEYEAAYQDLVKADQLGASDQELMQRQVNLRNAEARLNELNQIIESSRVQESAKKRDALLSDVLASLPPGQNPMRAFDRALKQAGFTDTSFTDAEKAKISRFVELSGMQEEQQPSPVIAPNEGGDFGIKEKIVSSTPATKTVADLVNSGWKWDGGWNLSGPKGEVKKLKGGERQFLKNHVAKVRAENAASGISSAGSESGNRDQDAGVGDAGLLDGGNRPASDGSSSVSLAGAPDGAVQSAVPVVVPDQPGNSLTQGEGGNGLSSTEQVAEEAVQANDAQAGAEQGSAPTGEVGKQSSKSDTPNLYRSGTKAPDKNGVYELKDGKFAKYENGLWYRATGDVVSAGGMQEKAAYMSPHFRIQDDHKWREIEPSAVSTTEGSTQAEPTGTSEQGAAPEAEGVVESKDENWLKELFGNGNNVQGGENLSPAKPANLDLGGLVNALRDFSNQKLAEANDWAGRQYKENKQQVTFSGDGPSSQESMSVSAVNESRRRRNVESLQKQAQLASNLANRIERGHDVSSEVSQAIRNADSDIQRDGKPRFGKTREEQIEAYISNSLLGDDYYGFGEGTVSNLLRKAYESNSVQSETVQAEPAAVATGDEQTAPEVADQQDEQASSGVADYVDAKVAQILADFENGDFETPGDVAAASKEFREEAKRHTVLNHLAYSIAAQKFVEGDLKAKPPGARDPYLNLEFLENLQPKPLAKKIAKVKDLQSTFKALFEIAPEKDIRYYLNGIHFDESGELVVTDGHRIAVVSGVDTSSVQKSDKGFTVQDRDGKWVDGRYPDWRRVMPESTGVREVFDSTRLGDQVRAVMKAARYTAAPKDVPTTPLTIRVGDESITLAASYVADMADTFRRFGYDTFEMSATVNSGMQSIIGESLDGKVRQRVMAKKDVVSPFATIGKDGYIGESRVTHPDYDEYLADKSSAAIRQKPEPTKDVASDQPLPAERPIQESIQQAQEGQDVTPNYKAGDRITPDHDVIEGDVVKSEDGNLWMAKVKRGISMPVLPIEDGKPVVNADVARRFDLTQTVVTHTGMNVYGHGGQPKLEDSSTGSIKDQIKSLNDEIEKTPFMQRSEKISKLIDLVVKDTEQDIASGLLPAFRTGQGTFAVVHPSAQNEGMYQITRYSDRGVFGDSQYRTLEEAIRDSALWNNDRMTDDEAAKALESSIAAESEYQAKKEASYKEQGAKAFADGKERKAPEFFSAAEKARWFAGYDEASKSAQGPSDNNSTVNKESDAEFTHNGVRIYPVRVNVGGEPKSMWGVESFENKAKREAGERHGFGDGLHDTVEQAKSAADRMIRDQKEQAELDERQRAKEADERAKKEAIDSDTINGFLDGKAPNQKALIRKALDKLWRFDGDAVMSARQRVESLLSDGRLEVGTYEENNIKPMSRSQFNRASQREQDAHEKKMREAGTKTVYLVSGSDLGKTAYDYAQHLLGKQSSSLKQNSENGDVDFKGRLKKYNDTLQSELDRGVSIDAAHQQALGMAGLTGDGLLKARSMLGLPATSRPGTWWVEESDSEVASAQWDKWLSEEDELNAWFGNSQVVGPDGRPLTVYHTTYKISDAAIEKFDRNHLTAINPDTGRRSKSPSIDSIGTWFSNNPGATDQYGEGAQYPAHLKITRPKVFGTFGDLRAEWDRFHAQGLGDQKLTDLHKKQNPFFGDSDGFVSYLKGKGFDGIILLPHERQAVGNDMGSSEFKNQAAYVVFDGDQVRSVFDRREPEAEGQKTLSTLDVDVSGEVKKADRAIASEIEQSEKTEAYKSGFNAGMTGYAMLHPSNIRSNKHKSEWDSGWIEGNKNRDAILRGMSVIEKGKRKAVPKIISRNGQFAAVWAEENSGKQFDTAQDAIYGLSALEKRDEDFDKYLDGISRNKGGRVESATVNVSKDEKSEASDQKQSTVIVDADGEKKPADQAIQEIDNQLSLADQLLACVLS